MPLERDHRHAADAPRLGVRERLRLQQPRRTASTCRPTSSSAPSPSDIEQLYVRDRRRADGAARQRRRGARRRRRRRSSATSTCSARRRSTDRRRPGSARARRCRRWSSCRSATLPQGMTLRVVGAVARGDQGGQPVGRHLRPRPAARLPDARGAVREPRRCRSSSCSAVPLAILGALLRAVGARPDQRRLLPDRAGHADRPGGEERDPDRRVRRAAARARACRSSTRRSRRRASGCGRS